MMLQIFKQLCRPSQLFAVISSISLIMLILQNSSLHNNNELCVGMMKCQMSPIERTVLLGFHAVYIGVWVIILDSLCKNKYGNLAWALVLLPFALAAIGLGHIMYNRM